MVQQIAKHISDNVSGLTLGTNLYAGFIPEDSPDDCVGVYNRTGQNANYYLPDLVTHPIQFYARSTDYFTAEGYLNSIFDLLTQNRGFAGLDLTGTPAPSETGKYFLSATHLSGPFHLSEDDKGRFSFSLNFIFRYDEQGVS